MSELAGDLPWSTAPNRPAPDQAARHHSAGAGPAQHHSAAAGPAQLSLDELDQPLRTSTFVVVDLETTGGAHASDAITEIGAVKVCGGEVVGEFATLVNPGTEISAFITVLTGITNGMVLAAPPLSTALPAFLEFAAGAVLVAHNAPFDIGFLKAGCHRIDTFWPKPAVLDTAVLARRVLSRDEVANCKLATLAAHFGAATTPNHRALSDARATVDVFHALLGRLGNLGVHSLPELRAFTSAVTESQRRKRHLAAGLPHAPGVYLFYGATEQPLYVGTSNNLHTRVRQYFVASEKRSRMAEMVGLAESVRHIVCAHALEAQVRELRLISELKPRYNRRSKNAAATLWLKLTQEPYPRLSLVRAFRGGEAAHYLGPLSSAAYAEQVRAAIYDAIPIRQCTDVLRPARRVRAACALAGMHRCPAPCEDEIDVASYAQLVAGLVEGFHSDPRVLIQPLQQRIAALSTAQRYEEAAIVRDRVTTLLRLCARRQSLDALNRIEQLVAARADGDGGWELIVVRSGRLAGAEHARRGSPPMPVIESMVQTAEVVLAPHDGPGACVLIAETELILRWLTEPGVRLVELSRPYYSPAFGAAGLRSWLANPHVGRAAHPLDDRRSMRTLTRPTRRQSA